MNTRNLCRTLSISAAIAAPALADSIARDESTGIETREMEHVEVIGKNFEADSAGADGQQAGDTKQRLQLQHRLEQVQLLKILQRQQLERFRAQKEEALVADQEQQRHEESQEAASAEELRLERERAEELRRQEEERARTEAEAQTQREPS
ncbi:hypothetical protein [Microbulbifer taiwanensis]|uniref:Uncharacterized protein n=1 Tax=Microbulbifer taiwanensis TaxID=986746 RepID=A0ABW1YNG4_9GAMM|nr:hypothetical protein [Microbulbifer taiwanensis]